MSSKHLDITVDSLTRADYGTYYGIYIDLIPKGDEPSYGLRS